MLCYKKDLIEGTENIKFLGKHFLTEDLFFSTVRILFGTWRPEKEINKNAGFKAPNHQVQSSSYIQLKLWHSFFFSLFCTAWELETSFMTPVVSVNSNSESHCALNKCLVLPIACVVSR